LKCKRKAVTPAGDRNASGDGDDGKMGERWPSNTSISHTPNSTTTLSFIAWAQWDSTRREYDGTARKYDGTAAGCQGFLLQMDLYLATVHPAPSGGETVNAHVSCLSGKALEWANAVWNNPD
jgi:hypothetical protein